MSRFIILFCATAYLLTQVPCKGFSQNVNGINLQSRQSSRIIFIPENSKMKVRLNNGAEISGKLTGADSNNIFITKSGGNQVMISSFSIKKMVVFHDHKYFSLIGSITETGAEGCFYGASCDAVGTLAIFAVFAVLTVGELIIDVIADLANDDYYDLKKNWFIKGPVTSR